VRSLCAAGLPRLVAATDVIALACALDMKGKGNLPPSGFGPRNYVSGAQEIFP
jgi:hypothetical protein